MSTRSRTSRSSWTATPSLGAAAELQPSRGVLLLTTCVFVALRLTERLFGGGPDPAR